MVADSFSCVEPVQCNPRTPYFDFSKNEYVVEVMETGNSLAGGMDVRVGRAKAREASASDIFSNSKKEYYAELVVTETLSSEPNTEPKNTVRELDESDEMYYEIKYSDRRMNSEGVVQPDGILRLDEPVLSEYTAYEKLSRYYDVATHWQKRSGRAGCGYRNSPANAVHDVGGIKTKKLVQGTAIPETEAAATKSLKIATVSL
ncbi:hypothetical protein POJ06DRAFT_110223 [Lipomyces tetrasporus]|uniref:Uncharacterized protein n=1 Tax=Lipomyces tetrasporus TaxID=54092 RepID=A0AAD7QSW2_9ASCO|nr:uncharacterized protein POJ06DRAFT_110223 [Lipomyces tetrasporus]KAJ8100711.1 hypothetical protein POJ06DRAFT_110223 [Lipomyces tetrasporus]